MEGGLMRQWIRWLTTKPPHLSQWCLHHFPLTKPFTVIINTIKVCQSPIRLTRLFFCQYKPGLTLTRIGYPGLTRISAMSTGNSEKEAAIAAAKTSPDSPTIFDKIINKEIPANVVFEDEKVLAFRDINPQAPTHILIIPKVKDGLSGLSEAEERHFDILGRLLYTAKVIAKQEGLEDGFRIVINDGPKGCQSVYHIHVHLLGGRQMTWPAG